MTFENVGYKRDSLALEKEENKLDNDVRGLDAQLKTYENLD